MVERDVKLAFILHLLLALVAVASAATVVFQSKYMGLVSPVVIFLLPLISWLLWAIRKVRGITFSGRLQRYLLGFRIAVMTGWGISLLPGLFWSAVFFHIYEPWPFSLKQGPDTAYAEEGLVEVLAFNQEAEISQVYYKGYDLRGQDRYLRFNSCSKVVEDKVVIALEKVPGGESTPAFHLNSRLWWWFTASEAVAFEHWASDFKEVWIDRQSCTFYVRTWTD